MLQDTKFTINGQSWRVSAREFYTFVIVNSTMIKNKVEYKNY